MSTPAALNDSQNDNFYRLCREVKDACLAGDVAEVHRLFAEALRDDPYVIDTLTISGDYPLASIRCLLELGVDSAERFAPRGAFAGRIQSVEAMELLVKFGYDIKTMGHLILQ